MCQRDSTHTAYHGVLTGLLGQVYNVRELSIDIRFGTSAPP
jgi:hypothetical protein